MTLPHCLIFSTVSINRSWISNQSMLAFMPTQVKSSQVCQGWKFLLPTCLSAWWGSVCSRSRTLIGTHYSRGYSDLESEHLDSITLTLKASSSWCWHHSCPIVWWRPYNSRGCCWERGPSEWQRLSPLVPPLLSVRWWGNLQYHNSQARSSRVLQGP